MRLYLVQHALAKRSDEEATRPLSDQGREDITRTAGFLSLFEKPRPRLILHSGKLRAEQTAAMIAEAWGGVPLAADADLAPLAPVEPWLDRLNHAVGDLLLVGHLPHLASLAGLLLCGDADCAPVRFRNGGILCLERNDSRWQLLWQINPTLFYGE